MNSQADSQLFSIRVWLEELGDARSEVRGQATHVLSGESTYFRDWTSLNEFLDRFARHARDDAAQRPAKFDSG